MKKIEDYLYFYIGQYAMVEIREDSSVPWYEEGPKVKLSGQMCDWIHEYVYIKPILIPISKITKKELIECHDNVFGTQKVYYHKDEFMRQAVFGDDSHYGSFSAAINVIECLNWALRKGFDLFGLIEAGLAIDKTKQKE